MKARCKALAKSVILLADSLPQKVGAYMIAKQLARSGGSISANYRAACRSRSKVEWIAKLGIVEEEADETIHWLELAEDCGYVTGDHVAHLRAETNEILSIVIASIRTGRSNLPKG